MGGNRIKTHYPVKSDLSTTVAMSRLQPLFDIAEICARKGIQDAVLCPGSRCAPLTLAFVRHQKINTRTFSDERSAAFIANGFSLSSNKPTVLICTSGSAAYNFSPAVAEAFFQHIPLLVLSADRPKEWIDQLDGQTIRQSHLYGKNVKGFFELPQDYGHTDAQWHINRVVNEAINLASQYPQGPVHINIPLREPLYPGAGEGIAYSDTVRIIDQPQLNLQLPDKEAALLKEGFASFNKIMVVAGQQNPDQQLTEGLEWFSSLHHVPVITDIISNQHGLSQRVRHADALLGNCKPGVKKALQPELLITFGNAVISKNLKLFLRQYKPQQHWHVQENGEVADTFQSLSKVLSLSPTHFFKVMGPALAKAQFEARKRENYYRLWEAEDHRVHRAIATFFSPPQLSEFHLVDALLKLLPNDCHLHLANSMPVRYANYIGLDDGKQQLGVFANRGTSGIDGCTSTALGHALASQKPTFLITGDMAFFYDRNAFWHNYPVPNLRIVVLNNQGGAIFSMIDGPGRMPEAETYFVTQQKLTAQHLAHEYGFDYLKLDSLRKMKNLLKDFFEFDGRTKIMEIITSPEEPQKVMEQFKLQIKKSYEMAM